KSVGSRLRVAGGPSHVAPASRDRRIAPRAPTTTAYVASPNATPWRSASIRVSRRVHVVPPSAVERTVPDLPTATPCFVSPNATASRSTGPFLGGAGVPADGLISGSGGAVASDGAVDGGVFGPVVCVVCAVGDGLCCDGRCSTFADPAAALS